MEENNTPKESNWKQWIFNKYVFILAAFILWMLFFDTNSYMVQRELDDEIQKLKDHKAYYDKKLERDSKIYKSLKYSKKAREKYARENYFMKKNNEDIFIVVHQKDSTKSK